MQLPGLLKSKGIPGLSGAGASSQLASFQMTYLAQLKYLGSITSL